MRIVEEQRTKRQKTKWNEMQDLGIRREKERQRRRRRTGGSGKSKKIFTTKSFLFPPVVGVCFPMSRDFSSTSLPFPVTFRRVIRPFISHADARGNLCDIDTTRGATRARARARQRARVSSVAPPCLRLVKVPDTAGVHMCASCCTRGVCKCTSARAI